MSLSLSDEQLALRDALRKFLAQKSTSATVRELMAQEAPGDPAVWAQMASELGILGIAIDAEYGGSGQGIEELAIVMEEMGRVLLVSPFFATIALAAQVLSQSTDEDAKARWLPGIADGSLTATVALAEDSDRWELESVETTAARTDDGWRISGTKHFVPDGHTADLLLVVARAEDGLGLFAIERGSEGLETSPLDTLDQTRRVAVVNLSAVHAMQVQITPEQLQRGLDLSLIALGAEQVGGTQACLDMATDYAKIRVQFGRPIGSFQAIKHKLADVLVALEAARSAVSYAATAASEGSEEVGLLASLAKAWCSPTFTAAAKENIQIHGGIGYTWEHDSHLYLRRAKCSEQLFGTTLYHRRRVADLVGI